jgi:hypothetical protein
MYTQTVFTTTSALLPHCLCMHMTTCAVAAVCGVDKNAPALALARTLCWKCWRLELTCSLLLLHQPHTLGCIDCTSPKQPRLQAEVCHTQLLSANSVALAHIACYELTVLSTACGCTTCFVLVHQWWCWSKSSAQEQPVVCTGCISVC